MGVREFDAWLGESARQAEKASGSTGPETWDGYESDEFWQDAHKDSP